VLPGARDACHASALVGAHSAEGSASGRWITSGISNVGSEGHNRVIKTDS